MAVILEARHFHDDAMNTSSGDNEIIGPSLFYIEEISDTLDHLRSTGIENLASVWLHSNKRPEVSITDKRKAEEKKEKRIYSASILLVFVRFLHIFYFIECH